jgi:hypothetical protein
MSNQETKVKLINQHSCAKSVKVLPYLNIITWSNVMISQLKNKNKKNK